MPLREKVAVLMPTRRPPESSSAPPELPALMEASVCAHTGPRIPLSTPRLTDCCIAGQQRRLLMVHARKHPCTQAVGAGG